MSATPVTQHIQIGSFARVMRVLFIAFAWLFVLGILVQVFLAGLNIFAPSPSITWNLHVNFAHFIEFIPLLLILFALLGRFPRAMWLLSLLLMVQFILQYAFIKLPPQINILALSALHPVNALVMFWVSIHVAWRASKQLKV